MTVPKEIREFLKVGPGDRIKWFRQSNGIVMILPVRPTGEPRPSVRWKGKPVSIEEMDKSIARAATARYRRSQTS